MFRIRRIYDDVLPVNAEAVAQVKTILRERFGGLEESEIEGLGEQLRNPFKKRFRTILYVAEDRDRRVQGFALVLFEPELRFSYLEFIATPKRLTSRGIGGVLYEWVREEAAAMGSRGLFFECLPDDPAECSNRDIYLENRARLRFYERWGARPIVGTGYELPVTPGDRGMPHLVFDALGDKKPLRREFVRQVVRVVLERKYHKLCPPEYVERVVASIKDDPVRIRDFRYTEGPQAPPAVRGAERVLVVVNDRHEIHHVRDRGYVEAPARVRRILAELDKSGLVARTDVREYSLRHVKAVHASDFVEYLKRVCANVGAGKPVYPYVFPLRNVARPPKELAVRAGYYCIDTFTPLDGNAYRAAKRAVDCTLTAAEAVVGGQHIAYALVRPPGHHAEHRSFGGFCYFNNNAVAANWLTRYGPVAILDVDYHHGNGQQDIFYKRADVLTISIHGHPNFAYPYFSGFEEERGEGPGEGFNLNIPLPEIIEAERYRKALERALRRIQAFKPTFLVVALGLDPAKGDPTGTWSLLPKDFHENGRMVGALRLPTLVVQEGGYRTRTLGQNARAFFEGLVAGARRQ